MPSNLNTNSFQKKTQLIVENGFCYLIIAVKDCPHFSDKSF